MYLGFSRRGTITVPQNIYVVVLVYLRVVAPCSRKLRCAVNSWYHRVVASRSLLFQIVSNYFRQLITTLTHGHRWQPDVGSKPQLNLQLRRIISFRVTTIYTTPTLSMASFVHVILTEQLLVHLRNIFNAE